MTYREFVYPARVKPFYFYFFQTKVTSDKEKKIYIESIIDMS